jgi:iron(III) transport system substrate-binding protein
VLSEPREGTASEIGGVAVVRGGPDQELGQRFVTWLLSKRAQDLMSAFYRVPLNPNAVVAEKAVVTRDVKVVHYDAAQAAARQAEILAHWRQITGR